MRPSAAASGNQLCHATFLTAGHRPSAEDDRLSQDIDFFVGSWDVANRRLRARWEQAFSVDGEATWETNWIMEFTRR